MEIVQHKVYFALTAFIIGCASLVYIYYYWRKRKTISFRPASEVFTNLDIQIVPPTEIKEVINNLRSRSKQHNALGFDCEWVTGKSGRQPVSLLQLAAFDGYCALFRLHLMKDVPRDLVDLLKDRNIFKVGVAPHDDAKYLTADYGIGIHNTLDIRHLVEMIGENPAGLGHMSQSLLGVTLDKRRKTRCSDWEAPDLSPIQTHYAASDAYAAIQIFVQVLNKLCNRRRLVRLWRKSPEDTWSDVNEILKQYADLTYNVKHKVKGNKNSNKKNGSKDDKISKKISKRYTVRSKPLYDNCYMHAPDGELLCTCDSKKALWYVNKGLADIESEDPLTVRLRFEPAGRSVGDVGKFYKTVKENKCVVCGSDESYIRKNVVPREYRKFFPELMKDHSSHDVLLLCVRCHQRSNAADRALRDHLAVKCSAPIGSSRPYTEESQCKSIRMAARALLSHERQHILPEARRRQLESVILEYYTLKDHTEVTEELLKEAVHLSVMKENTSYTSEKHGQTVVEYYLHSENGLLDLETLWREHFLYVMNPLFLPELWSLNHNKERLYIKYKEGRINDEDLKTIGVRNCKW